MCSRMMRDSQFQIYIKMWCHHSFDQVHKSSACWNYDYMHFNLCWPTEDGLWNSINPVQSCLGEVDTAIKYEKRLFAMMAIFICENRARQINSSYIKVRPLQWAKKKWQDENLRFSLKCKLQGLSWLKTGLMILQPQHAQDYITLCSNHW